jgi:hypothetical protein
VDASSFPTSDHAQLHIGLINQPTLILGAFQRAAGCLPEKSKLPPTLNVAQRWSGGPTVFADKGSIHLWLFLPSVDALEPCDTQRLLNRHVRPLLKGLTRAGAQAAYFGRDWITIQRRPAAWIGFAHHAEHGSAIVEAIVGVQSSFVPEASLSAYPAREHHPFLGKTPGSLNQLYNKSFDQEQLTTAIQTAYEQRYPEQIRMVTLPEAQLLVPVSDWNSSWQALEEDVIGFVGVQTAPGTRGVGGDFFASNDVITNLNNLLEHLPESPTKEQVHQCFDQAWSQTGFALDGLKRPNRIQELYLEHQLGYSCHNHPPVTGLLCLEAERSCCSWGL